MYCAESFIQKYKYNKRTIQVPRLSVISTSSFIRLSCNPFRPKSWTERRHKRNSDFIFISSFSFTFFLLFCPSTLDNSNFSFRFPFLLISSPTFLFFFLFFCYLFFYLFPLLFFLSNFHLFHSFSFILPHFSILSFLLFPLLFYFFFYFFSHSFLCSFPLLPFSTFSYSFPSPCLSSLSLLFLYILALVLFILLTRTIVVSGSQMYKYHLAQAMPCLKQEPRWSEIFCENTAYIFSRFDMRLQWSVRDLFFRLHISPTFGMMGTTSRKISLVSPLSIKLDLPHYASLTINGQCYIDINVSRTLYIMLHKFSAQEV
jgi:hypothetical protein